MKNNVKTMLITEAILITILAVTCVYLIVSSENSEEKIDFLERELATKNLHYEWLSEITNQLIANNVEEFLAFGDYHIDYSDPNWECKKTINMWELAKKDYPHFVDDTKWLADKKCGFDVSNITS